MDTLRHTVCGAIQITLSRLPWRSKGISQSLQITRRFIRELSYPEQNRTSGVFRLLISDIGVLLYFGNEVCRVGDLVEHGGVCATQVDWTRSSWEKNACTLCVVIWKLNTEQASICPLPELYREATHNDIGCTSRLFTIRIQKSRTCTGDGYRPLPCEYVQHNRF